MKISKVNIRNYHSLEDFELLVDNYSILIGPNGSGKSSVLYALDWFFNDRKLEASDIHNFLDDAGNPSHTSEEIAQNPEIETIQVVVTFSELTARDRSLLQSYGKGETAVFRKTWRLSDNITKFVGNAFQGSGFSELRTTRLVSEMRTAYNTLRGNINNLPDLGPSPSKENILAALQQWEDEPLNAARLVQINDADANHMFGFNGPNVMKSCITFTLIPASCDMTTDIAQNKKGSTLNTLIGTLMNNAGAAAKQAWIENHRTEITNLTTEMKRAIDASTNLQSRRINGKLERFIPAATIEFGTTIPDWIPNPAPEISTKVSIDGSQRDISKQGDGVQRAVMIAMFESLVPDREYLEGIYVPDPELGETENRERFDETLTQIPAMIISIEEPEIYQHPVRARAFGRTLYELSTQANAQVIIATHSPYFVHPKQFESIRRFSLQEGCTTCKSSTFTQIAHICNIVEPNIRRIVDLHLPTTFSEGFFSDKVALVEGVTDKAVLEAIADKMDMPFDCNGVSMLAMNGKDGMQIPYQILETLEIPAYIVVDGDSLSAQRKHPRNLTKQTNSDNTIRTSTEGVIAWLPAPTNTVIGHYPYTYRDPSIITDKFTFWCDDIESELENWTSFKIALTAIGGTLRSDKNLQIYRQAVMEADIDDIPETLKKCVEAIIVTQ